MELHNLREIFFALAQTYPAILLAYLFGSQVEGRTGPLSDIDFAILLDRDSQTPALQAHLHHELALLMGTGKVDVVWLPRAPIELQHAVISQGVVLYQQSLAVKVEYEAYVMGRYGDYLPILRAQREAIFQEGRRENRIQWYRTALGRTERTLDQIRAAQAEKTPGV
jgi:predicted nucleotidyltransferase